MSRRHRMIALLFVGLMSAPADVIAADRVPRIDPRIAALARGLAAADFSQRQSAEAELLGLGPAAIPELKRSLRSAELEARYRLERIIGSLERAQRDVALSDLRDGRPANDPHLESAWSSFARLVGDAPEARELFVEMVRAEPWLVGALSGDIDQLRHQFERRCADVNLRRIQHQESRRPIASVAALLLAASQPDCQPSATAIACITACVDERAFLAAMEQPDRPAAVERLLAAWVSDPQSSPALKRLQLAAQFELIEGVDVALQIIDQRLPGPQLQHAVLYLAKTGSTSHLHELELLLNDTTELQSGRRSQGSQPVVTFTFTSRMQDVALAALLHLTDQDPRTYGFSSLRESQEYLYQLGTIGFENEVQRRTAIARWRRWSADHLKQVQPFVEQAAAGYST